jgi:phage-related protein
MLAQAEQGVQAEVGAVQTGTAEKVKLQQEYSDSTVSLHENLTRELQGIGASEEEQEKLRLEARQDDVSAQYEQQIDAARKYYQSLITDAKGNTAEQARLQAEFEAEKTRLEQAAQQDRDLVAQIAVKERAQQELEEAKKAADAKAKEEERIYGIINDLEEKDLSDSEQLQLEKARVLAGIDDEYGSEKARIAAAYDAQITKAEEKEEQDRRDARRDSLKSWIDDWQSAVGMVKQVIGSMKGAFDEVMSTATGFVDFFASGLETLTGFSFNLSDAISEAQGNLAEIQEGTAGMGGFSLSMADVGSVSDDLVAGMVDAAEAFVMTAIDAVPALMAALVERLPDLISTLVEAIPEVVAALASAIPGLVQMFVTEAPKVIEALVQGMPLIVQGLVDGLPQIVDMLIGLLQSDLLQTVLDTVQMAMDALITELPRLIVALVEAIPGLFKDILAHLPSVISGLIAGIADIIVAIIDAIPEIVVGLIDALPGILIALIDGLVAAIPTIIVSILEAIPEVIGGVVGGIPEIFSAILSRIPSIITMLIGMIPDLILAFVQGLPDMLPAFISLFPDLIAALLTYMPEIVIAFLKALFVELPKEIWQMVPALGTAFKDAFVSAFDAIVETFKNIFQAAWESITSLFGGGEDKGGAYSGIDYVPATMRMTLHPGEAVIPASRNPMNRGGRADMPLAGGRASVGAFAGGGSGSNPTIQILMNGRVVEEIMQEANQLGQATMLTQKTRKIAGVKAGFDRGPFQKYGG